LSAVRVNAEGLAGYKDVPFLAAGDRPGWFLPRAPPQPPPEKPSGGASDTCYSRRIRKATTAFASHEENWFVFSRSHRPPLTRTGKINGKNLLVANAIPATRIHEDSLKKKTAFPACDVSQRSFPCPAGGNVFGGSSNRSPKGIGGTPQCVSTRRPTSRPRKA